MNETTIKTALVTWLAGALGSPKIFTITFNADFVAGNTISASFNATAITPVTYSADHATTILALAKAIQKHVAIFTAVVTGARQITCTGFNGQDITVTGPTVAGGASQAAATVLTTSPQAAVTVILADQDAPRPAYPYATIRLMSTKPYGFDDQRDMDDDGIVTVAGQRGATVSVHYFGDNPVGSLEQACNSLEKQTVLDQLYASGIAVQSKEPIQNVSAALETHFDPHATFDFYIGMSENNLDDVGVIEHVELTGEVDEGIEKVIIGPDLIGV